MRWRGPEVTNYKTARTILDIERYVNLFISRRIACRLSGLLAVFIHGPGLHFHWGKRKWYSGFTE